MKRFIVLILIALFFACLPVHLASAETPKALFLYWRGETECGKGLKSGMEKLGLKVNITEFSADQDKNKLNEYIAAVDDNTYSFIYTFGTTVSLAAAKHFKNTPIVFGIVSAPVESGLIASWEKPGGNVTGVSHSVPAKDTVQLISSMGEFKNIGFIYNRNEKNSQVVLEGLIKLTREAGIKLTPYPVDATESIDAAVKKMTGDGLDLVYLPSDSLILSNSEAIVKVLNQAKIPTYGALEKEVKNGCMIGIVSSYFNVGQELSTVVEEILKGKKPAEIPSKIMPFEQQSILINAKTVEAIGFEIPYNILQQAKIIE